jgi:hypothetical protein
MMMTDSKDRWISILEGFGVGLRILSFGTLSIMNDNTPFLAMWIVNTIDAILLTYCAIERHNKAYILMNLFWMIVGIVGICNSL